LHYIFPGVIARIANKSPGYELGNDLAGGHSVPEVGYDRFANGRFEGFGLIVDFDPHPPTNAAKLRHFMARVQCPGLRGMPAASGSTASARLAVPLLN
jgi:hypothetical protein